MRIPFLQKVAVRKVTSDATGAARERATGILEGILQELPELLLATVVDLSSGRLLAAYTKQAQSDPYKITAYTVATARHLARLPNQPGLTTQELQDLVLVLDEQLAIFRLTADQQLGCLLLVYTHDTNLALAREILRQHAS
ncbi:hypothetical protein MUN82_21170 [Hymenobacter aerilatus]|uniref:Uncharacterized protein n=1 Tax=Hymenobacter aerilatus TaxID=2932251 RepID=A0A8T9SU95_9BACT|nr:hypothetical protein [Hymenobacter aerilatus]UOR05425.1 hypothetical protein MUN82_21170 [Hymenobacter aerilatus]